MSKRLIGALLLISLAFAACGSESDTTDGTPADTIPVVSDPLPTAPDAASSDADGTVMSPIGPTLSVAALLETEDPGPYSVSGYLFVLSDGTIVLSDAIAESYPPQPGGARVDVQGVDLDSLSSPLVEPSGDSELATVQWTEVPIELIGSMTNGVFVGSTPAAT